MKATAMTSLKTTIAVAMSLLLGACASMAPDYQRPAAPVPATWPTGAAYGEAAASAPASQAAATPADLPWRSFIVEPRMQQVVAQALDGSRSLRKAVADVESARAQYRVQRAAQLPTVEAGGSGSRSRSLASGSGSSNSTVQTSSYSASVGLSAFEIDLFGRLRSLSDAALESYLATEEGARATRISLIAETASAWLTLAADQSKLAISQRTLASAERSVELTRQRLAKGVSSRVDVRQAETIYQQARADAASLATSIAQDRNALELLAGGPVADALLPQGLPEADSTWLAEVPAGLSSSVLLQRPDVLQAEHQLKSANADIGAARAKLFPSVTLTASGGVASAALSSLFSGGATIWSIAPSISLPIFDGGSARAGVAYSQAQYEGYVASYELAIQTAFKEVADALARRGTLLEQLAAQQALLEAAADSYRLADARYTKGVDTFLSALDSQRTLYSAETALVTARLTGLDNRVTLYRVLGGGLADTTVAAAPASQP